METYEVIFFYTPDVKNIPSEKFEFEAHSPTEAKNIAASAAKASGAEHFNVNRKQVQ